MWGVVVEVMTLRTSLVAAVVTLLALPTTVAAQLFGGVSQEQEIELGREAATMIEQDLRLLEDQAVRDYIDGLGQALVARSGRSDLPYTFTVVDTGEINAFALPGGFIYVHRGLIEAAANESELAGVLGHEIGHVVARHGVDQMQRAQIANVGLGLLETLLGRGRAATIGNIAADLVASGTFMKFSRDAEREADRLGARNVAGAGHAPRGMITFFETLDALRERDPNAVDQFFASHPSPTERMAILLLAQPWLSEVGLSRADLERQLTLLMIDRHWSDQVAFLRWLRDAVYSFTLAPNLHPYEPGRNPVTEFYQRAGEAFDELPARVEADVVAAFERVTITSEGVDWEREGLEGPSSTWTYLVDDRPTGTGIVRALASSPATNVWGGLILAPLVLLMRLAQRWRRRRAA